MTHGNFYCMTMQSCLGNLKSRARAKKRTDRWTDSKNVLDEGTRLFVIRGWKSPADSHNGQAVKAGFREPPTVRFSLILSFFLFPE